MTAESESLVQHRDAAQSPLDETHLWDEEDFEEEEEEEEVDEVEQEIEKRVAHAARVARAAARFDVEKEIEARDRARKRYEEEEKLKDWVKQHPEYMLVRRGERLYAEPRPKEEAEKPLTAPCISSEPAAEKKPAASSADEVRARIVDMIRKEAPALTRACNEAVKKEEEKQPQKKQPQKQTIARQSEKKAT